jgi:predicted DNA-binding protein
MTIRLDETLEHKIDQLSTTLGISKSELVRKSIDQFIASVSKPDPWTAGKDVFGKFKSGRNDLSTNRKKIVKDMLSRKMK